MRIGSVKPIVNINLVINDSLKLNYATCTIKKLTKNEMHIESHNIAFASHGLRDKKGKPIELTAREQECLTYLIAGKSAKQTGAILNISQRTVEFHLDNVKVKVGCRTKLELLGKVKGG